MVVEYFDQSQPRELEGTETQGDLYEAEFRDELSSVAREAMAETLWEDQVHDELRSAVHEALTEIALDAPPPVTDQ